MIRRISLLAILAATLACTCPARAQTAAGVPRDAAILGQQPREYGVLVQGGNGLTDNRDGFHFISAGAHAGKVLTADHGSGSWRRNFEYAVEAFPFWQSYTPVMQRNTCVASAAGVVSCSAPYNIGGTYTGVSVTPIILRINFAGSGRIAPWIQGAGGVLWTNHKYPAYGGPPYVAGSPTSGTLAYNAPNADASVWNFTPQFGIGAHYFTRPGRSIDLSANAIHISSASLGDKNPGVNASVHFALGYTWWKQ